MTDMIGMWLMIIGVLFDLFGCIGLVRLPDVYNRLQAATKCVTLGTCMILLGLLFSMGIGSAGIRALLCAVFILLTSPVAAHALARAARISGIRLWKGSIMDTYAPEADKSSGREQ